MNRSTTPPDAMPASVTVTLTIDEMQRLQRICGDSACYWYHLWQDATDGKRPDLDADSCRRINRKGWEMYEKITAILEEV